MPMHTLKSQGPKINSSTLTNISINNREKIVCLNSFNCACFFEIIPQFVVGKEPHTFFSVIKRKQGFAL